VKTLLIGIGNPGRRDDGLGPALIERLAGTRPPERAVVKIIGEAAGKSTNAFWAYQLNIEDASLVREYDRVIFVDAAVEAIEPAVPGQELPGPTRPLGVRMTPLEATATIAFTSHEMSPASVLALGEELYGRMPAGFLLTIRGSEWNFIEGLSAEAEGNLAEAKRILGEFLKSG
jgi:hydrogenase maturation protease